VHRHRYGDWTLPKGKLHPGESPLEGALREVREETGYQPRVLGFMGAIAYETAKGLKRVRYWNMVSDTGVRQPVDETEITEVVWLDPAEALSRLNYPLEQAILEASIEVPLPA
jgi:8-oxo-dGTP diphosphatase